MTNTESRVRTKSGKGDLIWCAKAGYHDPAATELIATFGFDAMWICQEHKRADPSQLYSMVQACRHHGVDAVVRVKPDNYTDLLWLIEMGVRGIMLPRVRTVGEVREAVDAIKFPPTGRRGYDGIHAEADFGQVKGADYMARANRGNYLVVQIEEPEVVPLIDAIAGTEGVEVLFVGPADLTLGMGCFGQMDRPEISAILRAVVEACRKHRKIAGIPCAPSQVAQFREMGFQFFNVVSDYRCLLTGLTSTAAELHGMGFPKRD